MTQKQKIRLAIPAFLLSMIGDYLMGINSIGTTSSGEMVWNVIPDWRLAVSSLLGAVCAALFAVAAIEAIKLLEQKYPDSKSVRLFKISNWAGIISFMFLHIGICMLIMIYNAGFDAAGSEAATEMVWRVFGNIALPLGAFFIIADVGVTVAWFGLILKGKLDAPKWTVLLNPLVIALIGQLINLIPLPFFGIDSGFESLGWLLMYVVLAHSLAK